MDNIKFNKGDRIVCIDVFDLEDMHNKLKIYQIYIVEGFLDVNKIPGITKSAVMLENISGVFVSDRFITLMQYRKQKVNKLLNKING